MVYDKDLVEELMNIQENRGKLANWDLDDDLKIKKSRRKKALTKNLKKAQNKEEEKSL